MVVFGLNSKHSKRHTSPTKISGVIYDPADRLRNIERISYSDPADRDKQTAETNFVALLAQAEASLEIMREQKHGHLVAISSISGFRGYRRALTVYAATKAAVTNLCEGMYIDLMGTDIKVSCVHPGFIRSEINEKVKKVPFIVDTETGVKAMVKAIEKEKLNSYVPFWPWAILRYVFPIIPRSMIRKMSW